MASTFLLAGLAVAGVTQAHVAAFAKGMYCENGTDPANSNSNSNAPVAPLYNLTKNQWWFQHDRGCDAVPPPPGVFLEIPAGGSFDVDLANNQAFSKLSYGGSQTSDWPDGGDHPDNWNGGGVGEGCIQDSGWIHTQNQTSAQGTAFAIAYESNLNAITLEDLVVFSVLEHTPWKRAATYQVPAAMPACPDDGCTCAFLWVPKGCGQPNMYMQGFKCKVTGATSTTPLAKAQAPTTCDKDRSQCVQGAKQMIVWNQLEGNNVETDGTFLSAPGYNSRNGFKTGAQDDIFESGPSAPVSSSSISSSSPSTSSSGSILISAIVSAPSQVQSQMPTTMTTVMKPASSTSSSASVTIATTFPGEQWSSSSSSPAVSNTSSSAAATWGSSVLSPNTSAGQGSPATVTVTVTATPTHSGHHYTDCWVGGDEVDG